MLVGGQRRWDSEKGEGWGGRGGWRGGWREVGGEGGGREGERRWK